MPLNLQSHLVGAMCLLGAAASLHAAQFTATWIGSNSGNWSDSSNWDIGRVPNNTGGDVYNVVWQANPVTITLTQPITIRNFTFAIPGVLTSAPNVNLTIQGAFDWSAGTLAGPANTTVTAAGTLSVHGTGTNSPAVLWGRSLTVQGQGSISSLVQFRVLASAVPSINIGGSFSAALSLADGAAFSGNGIVYNGQTLNVNDGTTPVTFNQVQIQNDLGRLLVGNRTVILGGGAGMSQRPSGGTMQMNGGTISNGVSEMVNILGGSLTGTGYIARAQMSSPAILSGQMVFDRLDLGDATMQVTLGGRDPGAFDHITVSNTLTLSGNLEVAFANQFQASVSAADVFEFLTIPSEAAVSGQFANVSFGGTIQSVDGFVTFTVQHPASSPHSVVLSNANAHFFSLEFADSVLYPWQVDAYCFLDPQAVLLATPNVQWNGGWLEVDLHDYDSGDSLIAMSSAQLGDYGMTYEGGRFSTRSQDLFNPGRIRWTFNANATTAAIQELLRRLAYQTDKFDGEEPPRIPANPSFYSLTLRDAAGATNFTGSVTFPYPVGWEFEPQL
jgi:hypothetical protein